MITTVILLCFPVDLLNEINTDHVGTGVGNVFWSVCPSVHGEGGGGVGSGSPGQDTHLTSSGLDQTQPRDSGLVGHLIGVLPSVNRRLSC